MRIALAQLNYIVGDFNHNGQIMKDAVRKAIDQNADLIVFAELAVCGYPPRDFLEFPDFIGRCKSVVNELAVLSKDIAIIVGSPVENPVVEGKDLFNAAFFLEHGKVKSVHHKALLPTYDVFDEYRYFESATEFNIIECKGVKIALTICEDIWNIGNENPLYTVCPMDQLVKQGPDVMINISASPFTFDKAEERIDIVQENVKRYGMPMLYCNHVGAQTELIFDGASLVINSKGVVVDEMPYFTSAVRTYDLEEVEASTEEARQTKDKIALIHDAIVLGIRDYFGKLGFKQAILGLSGGIDSAVTLALAAQALGSENVMAVLMPSEYSSDHSVNDSIELCNNWGCPHENISIQPMYESFLETLTPYFDGKPFNVAEENIQARVRGVILMALSNKHGYILLNTSNKSEAAVGYGTLYGDMAGGLSVIGDVYKTDVFALANYMNRDGELIPEHIITKPPSAELRPNQKDSDSLPDYDILDEILYQYIEKRTGPDGLIDQGFDANLVSRILKLVNRSEYKRYQTPPMLRVSAKAFGMGRRMPIVAKYLEKS